MSQYCLTPLSYGSLEQACAFSSTRCFEGIVAIKESQLRIIQVERLGETFSQKILRTKYTPTKMQVNPRTKHLFLIERDYNCYTETQRSIIKQKIFEETKSAEYLEVDFQAVGYPKPGCTRDKKSGDSERPSASTGGVGGLLTSGALQAHYASCLRIVDPTNFETVYLQEFENRETVFSLFVSQTVGLPGQVYLFLGVGTEATLQRQCKQASIHTYIMSTDGLTPQLIHRTPCEFIPGAFSELKGRLICGIGNILRVYEMGQKKLLRKQDNRNFKSNIVQIQCERNRIFVGDVQESIHVLRFKPE